MYIWAIEKYITDLAWENGWVEPTKPTIDLDLSVGIIGAGPGGLAAAERLRGAGFKVCIYDASSTRQENRFSFITGRDKRSELDRHNLFVFINTNLIFIFSFQDMTMPLYTTC